MRILLIDPPGITPSVNIGLGYLSSYLIAKGNEVKVLDFNNNRYDKARRLQAIFSWKPDFIGISITTSSRYVFNESRKLVDYCKRHYQRSCYYVAGGTGVTINPLKFLWENKDLFDFGIIGEGEITFSELVDNVRSDKPTDEIPGIVFQREGKIFETSSRPFVRNLDIFPFPNYEVFDTFQGRMESYPIITSRGCPFQCIFCLNAILSKRQWRWRSPGNIIAELKLAREKYSIGRFEIWDDNFALNYKRAIEFCNLLIAENLGIDYTLPNGIRADSITPELAQKLKDSGCKFVSVGVQDGNPETYPYVNTGETFEAVVRGIKILKSVGLPVMASMVIGLPHTTYQSTLKSMEFIKRIKVRACWFLATPFEGTKLYEWVCNNGRFLERPDNEKAFSFQSVVFDTPEFKWQERLKAYYIANMDYSFPEMAPNLYPYDVIFYKGRNAYTRILNSFLIVWQYNRKRFLKHCYIVIKRIWLSFLRRMK